MLPTTLTDSRRWLLSASLLCLSGCGLTQAVTDGTTSVVSAVFYKQIKTLHLDFSARESLNHDLSEHHPLSEPVMLHVYQLRDRPLFDGAVYQQLVGDGDEVLKTDLLARRDLVVTPGGAMSLDMPMEAETKFVAVIALFRHPDMTKNSWRLVLARNDLEPDRARVIELDSHSLLLKTEKP